MRLWTRIKETLSGYAESGPVAQLAAAPSLSPGAPTHLLEPAAIVQSEMPGFYQSTPAPAQTGVAAKATISAFKAGPHRVECGVFWGEDDVPLFDDFTEAADPSKDFTEPARAKD